MGKAKRDSTEDNAAERENAVKEPSLSDLLKDSELFENNKPGDYSYTENEKGKRAFGVLSNQVVGQRDTKAQRTVGGEDRDIYDDGGHLIAARYGGSGGLENLDAQNRNLNRGSYKIMENEWDDSLNNGEKVLVNIETYKREGNERPDVFMGCSITESEDGSRRFDAFSYQNESAETQEEWAKEVEEMGEEENPYENAMEDENYQEIQTIAHEDDPVEKRRSGSEKNKSVSMDDISRTEPGETHERTGDISMEELAKGAPRNAEDESREPFAATLSNDDEKTEEESENLSYSY